MNLAIGPQDMGRKRNFEVGEYKFVFEARDPYGFITVYCSKTKEHISSEYTDFKAAEAGAIKYANNFMKKV